MKQMLLAVFLVVVASSVSLFGQNPAEDTEVKRIKTALESDRDFQTFKTKLENITKSANGRNTNVAAVRKLFSENKAVLQSLKTKHRYGAIKSVKILEYKTPDTNTTAYKKQVERYGGSVPFNTARIVSPPYQSKWSYWHSIYGGTWKLRETNSNDAVGRIGFTVDATDSRFLSPGSIGYQQNFTVPSDPGIIAAKIKIEYSFFYTGWDTYTAKIGVGLFLNASANFHSPYIDQLTPYINLDNITNWKYLGPFVPYTLVTGIDDVTEFHADIDSSFSATAYVTPGSVLTFRIGTGYLVLPGTFYSDRGLYGSYHYGEFIVKKITMTYLKSLQ